jgi:hypothetical protein
MKNLVVACLLSAICCACRKLRKRRRRGLSPLIDPSSPQLHPMQRERRRLRQLPHRRRSCCHSPAEDAPAEGAPAQPGPAGDPRHVHRAGARSSALPAELHQHEAGGVHGHRLRERQVSMGVQGVLSNHPDGPAIQWINLTNLSSVFRGHFQCQARGDYLIFIQ